MYHWNTKEKTMTISEFEHRNCEVEFHETDEYEDEVRHASSLIEILCQREDALDKLDKYTYNNFTSFDADCNSFGENRAVQFDDNIRVRIFDRVSPEDRGNVFYTKKELYEFQLHYIQEATAHNQSTSQSFHRILSSILLCCTDI